MSFARLAPKIINRLEVHDGTQVYRYGVHREFAQIAVWEDGLVRQAGQIALTDEGLRIFANSLGPEDEVAIEATCNTHGLSG